MRGGTELMSEGMYRALEGLVRLIVERRYDELAAASRGRLAPEDLRRRIEEDYPVRLDLWDEEGEADMHIDGELESVGNDSFIATLDDTAF